MQLGHEIVISQETASAKIWSRGLYFRPVLVDFFSTLGLTVIPYLED